MNLRKGQCIADLTKAKIFSFQTGKQIANTGKPKSTPIVHPESQPTDYQTSTPITDQTFKPLSDAYLNDHSKQLSWPELRHIERHVQYSDNVLGRTDPDRDQDIIDYHSGYLDKMMAKLEHSKTKANQKRK